ncbi:MFS transporter [Streptomyces lonarensis]|uniref:MFS transporter n=1 Tax=Streptomyces lonarensis TaxID=700599 RepID=A0A7X6CZV5_9ACTN|nr:MFS transporter [Streptomyces lonarensis]NJQ05604.1 MFS transporter [Streptomyces lonarensis]
MCSSCGVPAHLPPSHSDPAPVPRPRAAAGGDDDGAAPRRFAALRNPHCRPYLFGTGLAMMADNVEHVITYWVLWQVFESPALTGFQVISHWLPFLLLSVWFGGLADRFDCRRVVQAAQLLFMAVSAAWGVLFLTDSLTMWAACVLLVLHGVAGSLWTPGEQLLLYDFVGPRELPSAVRLNATFRNLGVLCGPVVGSVLLIGLGPTAGIFVNVLFYLPLTLFLLRTRFTGHTRGGGGRPRVGLVESLRVLREVRGDRTLVSMIALAGLASLFVGSSLGAVMPVFVDDFGLSDAGLAYGMLLFASGVGGVVGGVLLEATGRVRPSPRAAVASTALYGASVLGFALTRSFPLALVLLLAGGVANLASSSIAQTIVQLRAPDGARGRVLGLYGMSANGLRVGSGLTVGVLGAAAGMRWSLGVSAAALCLGTVFVAFLVRRSSRAPQSG